MQELLKHPFVIVAVVFFVGFIGTISVLISTGSEKTTIDTGAGQIIEKTVQDVESLLDEQ